MILSKLLLCSLAQMTPLTATCGCGPTGQDKAPADTPPNILLVINDDQSYPYASAYGCTAVHTPGFDFVASHGVLFNNAYVTSPGSSPSRASLLTGLYPWQIAEAGTHASSFPANYPTYVDLLEDQGYFVGYTGKGWGPGDWSVSGRLRNPAGPVYNELTNEVPYTGLSKIDYASNFAAFLDQRPEGAPFCFWLGPHEPHRPYQKDSWKTAGHRLEEVKVPDYLPDAPEVRGDLLDYIVEIEWADRHLMSAIGELTKRGLLDNTIIIALADNGMAFPHAKANCYDAGLHVPLAICWTGRIGKGWVIDETVSTIDLFPTLLEAAGVRYPGPYSGVSLLPVLEGKGAEAGEPSFAGRERHSSARPHNLGYPIRSIRKDQWLLIHNFHPERWPAGNPTALNEDGSRAKEDAAYHDIDASPTSRYMIAHKTEAGVCIQYVAGMLKRPEYELFDLSSDPSCLTNLADDPRYGTILTEMKARLEQGLKETLDSRLGEDPEIWESYPRLAGVIRSFPDE